VKVRFGLYVCPVQQKPFPAIYGIDLRQRALAEVIRVNETRSTSDADTAVDRAS